MTANNSFNSTTVAVYGTLRHGMGNWAWALDKPADEVEYLGLDSLEGYRLLANAHGGIPFMVNADPSERVEVDLFKVHSLAVMDDLDGLEGHPNWYRRIPTRTRSGRDVETYLFPELNEFGFLSPDEVDAHGMCVVPDGDWVRWRFGWSRGFSPCS